MVKYHVNTLGNPGRCAASVGKCPYGDDSKHFTTPEAARENYEKNAQSFPVGGKLLVRKLKKKLVRPHNLDYDAVEKELGWINDWEKPWTDDEKANIAVVQEIGFLVEKNPFTKKDEKEVQNLIDGMIPYVESPPRVGGWNSNDTSWRARDKIIHSLADSLIRRRLADDLTFDPAEEITNDRLLNLKNAQEENLKRYNHPDSKLWKGAYLGDVEPHFQEAISRVVRGDLATPKNILDGSDNTSILKEPDRIFNKLNPESTIYEQKLYLASVFPVNELKKEMDRVGIDNVSVSVLNNGREWGNVYTVIQPDGKTRSFAVYEHRNTDSIIINGSENWNGEGLPYAGDSKNTFFAEFSPNDRVRAAQALTFYMTQAQQGILESDQDLSDKVSRRDWNAILDAQIPGFKAWRKTQLPDDNYVEAENATEGELLDRLDF